MMNMNDNVIATITSDVTESGQEMKTFVIKDMDGKVIKRVLAHSLEDLLMSNE